MTVALMKERSASAPAVIAACFVLLIFTQTALGATKCSQTGSSYSYTESVSSTTRTIVTNHCPNTPSYNTNPNYAVSTTTTITIPAYPQLYGTGVTKSPTTATSTATWDLSEQGGSVGVFFDGAMLYSPYGGTTYGQCTGFTTSATYAEGNSFDQCGGHSSSTSTASYHHHVPPSCLLQQLGITTGSHSPQIGWAADGFPIYGPLGPGGTAMKTCSVTLGTYGTDVCTDDCGGYYKEDATIDNFSYRYYIQGDYNNGLQCTSPSCPSPGEAYHPHTPMCFRGCCPSGVTCSYNVPTCSSGYANGYTSSYTPSTTTIQGSHDLSAGLSQNTNACACSSLSCESSTCSSQSWSSTTCNTAQATNDCSPASSIRPMHYALLIAAAVAAVLLF